MMGQRVFGFLGWKTAHIVLSGLPTHSYYSLFFRWREILKDTGNPNDHVLMKLLIQHFPEAAQIVLNKCIKKSVNMNQTHPDYAITYDFDLLDPGPDDPAYIKGNRYFGPATMVKYRRQELLLHPVTQNLLQTKWASFGSYFYYISFFVYFAFVICYTYFLCTERAAKSNSAAAQGNVNDSTRRLNAGRLFKAKGYNYYLALTISVFVIFQILKEIVQVLVQRLAYFKEVLSISI